MTTRRPADGSYSVGVATNATATFSTAVEGVTTDTCTLVDSATGAPVAATLTRKDTTNHWILVPSANLARDTRGTRPP